LKFYKKITPENIAWCELELLAPDAGYNLNPFIGLFNTKGRKWKKCAVENARVENAGVDLIIK